MQALFRCLCQIGLGICVHDVHVVNTVSPILPEVTDQDVPILLRGLYRWCGVWDYCGFGSGRLCLRPLHGTTCEYEAFITHVRGGDRFYSQVRDPVTELVVTRRDKAALLAVKSIADGKRGVASIAVMREVWGI